MNELEVNLSKYDDFASDYHRYKTNEQNSSSRHVPRRSAARGSAHLKERSPEDKSLVSSSFMSNLSEMDTSPFKKRERCPKLAEHIARETPLSN